MSEAQEMYDLYIAAEKAVLEGKEVWLLGRKIQYEDLDMIRAGRKEWAKQLSQDLQPVGYPTLGGKPFVLANLNKGNV